MKNIEVVDLNLNRLEGIPMDIPAEAIATAAAMSLGAELSPILRGPFMDIISVAVSAVGLFPLAVLDHARVYDEDIINLALNTGSPDNFVASLVLVFFKARTKEWLQNITTGVIDIPDEQWDLLKLEAMETFLDDSEEDEDLRKEARRILGFVSVDDLLK